MIKENKQKQMRTVKEIVEYFGISEYSIRAGIKQGKYPVIRIGGKNGKFLIDINLLEETLMKEALSNTIKKKI